MDTLLEIIKKYKINKLDGLNKGHSNCKKRRTNPEHEKLLVTIITTKTPYKIEFESMKNWTIELISRSFLLN